MVVLSNMPRQPTKLRQGRDAVERWSLARLHEHSLQRKLFFEPSLERIATCREEIHSRGLPQPLDVLPDGSVVSGYTWLLAAKLEGWCEVEVIVRQDLAKRNEAVVVEAFIRANLSSEIVSDLERAACYAEFRRIFSRYSANGGGDTRDQVAELLELGISGRELDRLVPLLKLPIPIQQAIARKKVSKSVGTKILALPKELQIKIAADVAASRPSKQIVKDYGLAASGADSSPQAKLDGLAMHLHDLTRRLADNDGGLAVSATGASQIIESADRLIRILRRRGRIARAEGSGMPPLPPNVAPDRSGV